mgnify:FL=1
MESAGDQAEQFQTAVDQDREMEEPPADAGIEDEGTQDEGTQMESAAEDTEAVLGAARRRVGSWWRRFRNTLALPAATPAIKSETIQDPISVTIASLNSPQSDDFRNVRQITITGGKRSDWTPWGQPLHYYERPKQIALVFVDGRKETRTNVLSVSVGSGRVSRTDYIAGDVSYYEILGATVGDVPQDLVFGDWQTILAVQKALKQLGNASLDPGNVDGTWKSRTAQAVRALKIEGNQPAPDSYINDWVLRALGITPSLQAIAAAKESQTKRQGTSPLAPAGTTAITTQTSQAMLPAKAFLTAKRAGLPTWGWGAIALGGASAFLLAYRGRR